MHFEMLVEDLSGKEALAILVPKIIGDHHTFRIHSYKGIGHIPKNMKESKNVRNRMLLNKLPNLLRGYGKTFAGYSEDNQSAVIIVCDLDDRCLKKFRKSLFGILDQCNPSPKTRFCIAIEEGEAWFLGDTEAIKSVYPKAKDKVLDAYEPDSICGTWEALADAVYHGGAKALSEKGWQAVGAEKSKWAKKIAPKMDIANNQSPSFQYFCRKLRELPEDLSGKKL